MAPPPQRTPMLPLIPGFPVLLTSWKSGQREADENCTQEMHIDSYLYSIFISLNMGNPLTVCNFQSFKDLMSQELKGLEPCGAKQFDGGREEENGNYEQQRYND